MSTTTAVLGKFLKKQTAVILPQVCHLHLQEYQSKELLRTNGCIVQKFFLVDRKNNEHHLLDELFNRHAYSEYVVKSQILAGGRGKGRFIGDEKGGKGVFITRSPQEAKDSVRNMIGKRLVTTQTSPKGVSVNQVMVAESVPIKRETYLSILMDSTTNGPLVVACPSGGVDIEEIAKKSPELILKEPIQIDAGISAKQCFKIAAFLEFEGKLAEKAAKQIQRLYELFVKVDSTQIEINPFAETADGHVFCIDAKLNFDDNAAFRQQQIFDMDTFEEMDVREINARKCGLNYIGLDGNIACMVNGAGLAMATMDIIKLHGGSPANFLDVGGGANKEQVYEAFKIITSDAGQVRVIFVNIFGGILRCDIIAEGVVRACSELKINIPVVLRLKGTRVNEAKSLLSNATHNQNIGGTFELLESFEEAANRAVELARS